MKKDKAIFKPLEAFKNLGWRWSPLVAFALVVGLFCGSCGQIKYVPTETNTEVHYVDSTIYHIKDSVRITERSRWKDYGGLLDTLKIRGNRSEMTAWTDTTNNILNGSLEEDPQEEKIKTIYKTKWKIKDSIKVVEKPVPYEVVKEVRYVPKLFKFCLWWFIGSVICIALYIFLKTKKHISI